MVGDSIINRIKVSVLDLGIDVFVVIGMKLPITIFKY